jgi:site-specific DNA recombinase
MPDLRKQKQAVESELQSLRTAAQDQSRSLRVLDTVTQFRKRLLDNADELDIIARRKILIGYRI